MESNIFGTFVAKRKSTRINVFLSLQDINYTIAFDFPFFFFFFSFFVYCF
jgi:hypothetical protein